MFYRDFSHSKHADTDFDSFSSASSQKRSHGVRLCFVFDRVQVWSDMDHRARAYGITQDGYISEREEW